MFPIGTFLHRLQLFSATDTPSPDLMSPVFTLLLNE